MLSRQKALLLAMRRLGGSASRLRLAKLLFPLRQEASGLPGASKYDFVPFKFGPYSFTMRHELNDLARDGYLSNEDEREIRLEVLGRECALNIQRPLATAVTYVTDRYGSESEDSLIDLVYRRFPWYSMNSERRSVDRVPRPVADRAVYTIGYEAVSLEELFNQLLRSGVTSILDVRSNPVSRRFGFHKSTLQAVSLGLGIEYSHWPELGTSTHDRGRVNDDFRSEELFSEYRGRVMSDQQERLNELARAICSRPSVLLCLEADPQTCHRWHLAGMVSPMSALPVIHLSVEESP